MIRSVPITPAPYAKLQPSPSDIRLAAEAISLILSVAEIDCARVIEQISVDIDRAEMLKAVHNYLSDLNGEITGPIGKAAEELEDARYEGVTLRGPFYRSRR